jgi:LuxR family maltose regulon positive regulatory protein
MEIDELPAEPEIEALAHLGHATTRLDRGDLVEAGAELELALTLSRQHAFDYLEMQCLALQGVIAGVSGDVRAMRTLGERTVAAAAEHGWGGSLWSVAGTAMLAYAALVRLETGEAERLSANGLALGVASSSPQLQFALRSTHGAAVFDHGERANGLAELQQARSELGDLSAGPEQAAASAMLEFRAALVLGHVAATRTVLGWLAERAGDAGELCVMRGWAEATEGRHDRARTLVRPVLQESTPALLAALAAAEPLDVIRPFSQAEAGVRALLVHQFGSFGVAVDFAERALAAGAGRGSSHAALSEREITVLRLLPSLLSLNEIADDLTVSVNTVKSHVRSIYAKLGVSSRRLAVLAAHEHGLLTGSAHRH